ncbi:MAG: sigma-54-dependent Fis family transcriptional regulator [Gemmatimonadales bacterium]|nr:sigma-54-dependent Fis family transcriptional regulator [Gemmatimonadales bacterium]
MSSPLVTDPNRSYAPGSDSSAARDPLSIPPEIKASIRILLVDDERTLRESCASVLQMDGFSVTLAGRGEEAVDLLKNRKFDIMLVDLYMSQVSGLELLRAALDSNRDIIVVVMTGNPSVSTSIEALRAGAWDYLPKPFSATHLQVLIGRASHAVMVNREASELRQRVLQQHSHSDTLTLIGISPPFRKAVELARKVALTDASVFISGESGTGKEVIAQFIHQHSRRSRKPLVAINCAALPEPLLESEMFGHRKGSFTGADRDKPGLLETANGGSFFLDELTEMPLALQAKLLRVIQDGVVRRVGSESTDAQIDVRFISATNRDPQQAVDSGVLRGDLFYRLRVVPIALPPLRKRQEDIPLLANHFLTYYWHRHRQMPDRCPRLSEESIAFLKSRPWRGNVRELQNVIEHTTVLMDPDQVIQPGDIPLYEDGAGEPAVEARPVPTPMGNEPYHVAKDRVVADFEKQYLTALVERAAGNMSKAARLAGVDRTTLYRLIDKHQLLRADGEGSVE